MSTLQYPFTTPPAAGTTLDVAPGVKWLRMPLPFALDHINLWLVDEHDGYTLVDTGYGDAATRSVWDAHCEATLNRRPILKIIATHYHPDHLGNAAWLSERFGAPIAMTAAEYLTAHAVHGQTAGYSVTDTCALFNSHGVADEHLQPFAARGNRYRAGVPELPMRFRRLHPGATVRIGGNDWRVIGGYGHSPEHAALHSPDRRVLISGDMLLPRISTNVSVGPAEPEGDPLARFLDSLRAFEAMPDDTLVLPSHGLPFRGIAARVAQLRGHHDARLAELLDAVAAGARTAADIVPVLFRRELDTQQRFFAVGEAIAHLNFLVEAGKLARTTDDAGRVRFAVARLDAGIE
jgi:glyoxylase-like metal-dependent hydrolase (beta-lactamase superfamily II)